MLLQLRDYITQHGIVSMQQISTTFNVAVSAVEPMLAVLIRKGSIKPYETREGCASACRKCNDSRQLYCAA